jgi:hypothetical protein
MLNRAGGATPTGPRQRDRRASVRATANGYFISAFGANAA